KSCSVISLVSEPLNTELISSIQQFCLNKVFDKLGNPGQRYDEYKPSWRRFSKDANGQERQGERMSSFTLEEIQKAVTVEFGQKNVDTERSVGSQSDLAFDLYNPSERTAFEICLRSIKNEFEKDIL